MIGSFAGCLAILIGFVLNLDPEVVFWRALLSALVCGLTMFIVNLVVRQVLLPLE